MASRTATSIVCCFRFVKTLAHAQQSTVPAQGLVLLIYLPCCFHLYVLLFAIYSTLHPALLMKGLSFGQSTLRGHLL